MTEEGEEAGAPAGGTRAATAPASVERISRADAGRLTAHRRQTARAGLSEQTRSRIAMQLRAMYDTVAQQPVPDRFADLIARLDGDHESV